MQASFAVQSGNSFLPRDHVMLHCANTIPIGPLGTPFEVDDEITGVPLTTVFGLFPLQALHAVTVQYPLIDNGQPGQYRRVPLDDVLQGMIFCFLERVRSIERIEPGVEEVLRPAVFGLACKNRDCLGVA